MQRQFTYRDATITLHRQRNGDLLDAELLVSLLMDGVDRDNRRAWQRIVTGPESYRDWETDRKSTRLNSSHSAKSRMPSSA